jgi:hypothetical protein
MALMWKQACNYEIMQMVPVRGQVHVRPHWKPHIEKMWVYVKLAMIWSKSHQTMPPLETDIETT